MDLINVASSVVPKRIDDDFGDRMNHIYSTVLLLIGTVVLTTHQYVGDTIDCWCPAEFTANYVIYANRVCWVTGTYYVPTFEKVSESIHEKTPHLRYYQWMPIILLTMALTYQIPCFIWRAHQERSGLNIENIIRLSNKYNEAALPQERDTIVKIIIKHFERYLEMRKRWRWELRFGILREIPKALLFWAGRKYGNYLCNLYMSTKLLYLANTITQFIMIDILLTGRIEFFGAKVLLNFIRGTAFEESVYFPRVALCDFRIKDVGSQLYGARHTVQCVLSINLFSEVVFTFYWFWLVLINFSNLISVIRWTYYILIHVASLDYIKQHIRRELITQKDFFPSLDHFVINYLKPDGIVALRLISANASGAIVTETVSALYENYKLRTDPK